MSDNKDFDAVEMMRKLRCDVDKQLEGKTHEEQRRYLDERVGLRAKSEKKDKRRETV